MYVYVPTMDNGGVRLTSQSQQQGSQFGLTVTLLLSLPRVFLKTAIVIIITRSGQHQVCKHLHLCFRSIHY